MKILIPKSEIDAQEASFTFGFRHALLDPKLGEDDGAGNIRMDAATFTRILGQYQPRHGQRPMTEAQTIAAVQPTRPFGPIRLRTPEERAALKAICDACDFKSGKDCAAAKCCGGRLPVETIWNLTSSHCEKGKF
jgi:hypothetical protein